MQPQYVVIAFIHVYVRCIPPACRKESSFCFLRLITFMLKKLKSFYTMRWLS
jgi:hypothetical protein